MSRRKQVIGTVHLLTFTMTCIFILLFPWWLSVVYDPCSQTNHLSGLQEVIL